jgi:hypothetical protein
MKVKMGNMKGKNFLNIILLLGLVVVAAVLIRYNSNKSGTKDSMTGGNSAVASRTSSTPSTEIVGASGGGDSPFMSINGIASQTPQNSCNTQPALNPSDLLPNDTNSEWANINPASNDLKNLNLLNPNQLIGINTVGSSLRNANLQIRSEPAIPKVNVGPWNSSTIETDTFRRPLEIGGCD